MFWVTLVTIAARERGSGPRMGQIWVHIVEIY